ncbi:hypothetical protein QE152_g1887 [Popillia japonica]|uniref:Uncharacterized protein n=1 Tax=Popillia japonica TaxID=7064 RepID=A0AAW1N4K4_POPJA
MQIGAHTLASSVYSIRDSNLRLEIVERLQDEDDIHKLKTDEASTTEVTHTQDLQRNCPTNESQDNIVDDELLRDNDNRLQSINQHRFESIKCLKKQATEMLQQKACSFELLTLNVLVKISEVDRGRLAPRNVLAVVLSEKEGLYQLGTSTDVLAKLYARSEFQLSETHTLFVIIKHFLNKKRLFVI